MSSVSHSADEGPSSSTRNPLSSPTFRHLAPPLIVVGMHRSGTSLVSGMLSHMGVYMDPAMSRLLSESPGSPPSESVRRLGYGEASCFRRLNDGLLLCAGADWRHVEPFLRQLDNRLFRGWCHFLMRKAAGSSLRHDYFAQSPEKLGAWGWKDPRNSITLPLWIRMFPEARVLHVHRDSHNVVESLLRRDNAFAASAGRATAPPLATRLHRVLSDTAYATAAVRRRLGNLPPVPKVSPFGRAEYYRLADMYVKQASRAGELARNYLEISYEEIVERPHAFASRMAEFAGVQPTKGAIESAVAFVERPAIRTRSRPTVSSLGGLLVPLRTRPFDREIIPLRPCR